MGESSETWRGMSVEDKLAKADELLKQWEGTDRYDEFKKRVDEMHAKYGQPAQQPGASHLQEAEKATPWVKQGINTLYNIAVGGGGTDMGISQVLDTVHDTYRSASQSVVQAGRNKIAKFVADAGKQAAAGVGEGTLKEAGFAREVAADLGRRGDLVLKQGTGGATGQAANLYKGANDMKKTAAGLEETARAAKAAASRQARAKAMNHVIDTGYQQTLKTAARKAGVKAATKVGVQLGAKAVASSVGPAALAAGAVESAVWQGADLADTMKNTGAAWSDVGKATGDVFTTKQGWKNLGWGLLGSLKDVASSVTLGAVDNGDKLRERMMAAKGGEGEDRFAMSRNFLATDKVPDAIFGIPVVANEDDYTPEDLAFFKEHPEAGGYYDMGEGTPEDGTEEGAPTQVDIPRRGKYPGIANNPGNVEKHERRTDKTLFEGEVGGDIGGGRRPKRFAVFSDPVSGLNAAASALARRASGLERKGLPFTIENYVPGYAPKSENDVEGYVGNVSRYSGIARNAAMDRWNVDDMARLLRTVVRFESGYPHSEWFTEDEYRAAAGRIAEGAAD